MRHQGSRPYKITGRIMILYILTFGSRSSWGSVVSDYGLDDRTEGVRSPTEVREFFL
jgi:hypothetical protein